MSEGEQKRIVEINGCKIEVDLRHAKVVDSYKIGDRVKLLIKKYDTYTNHVAMIVGFDAFEKLPTIIVAYLSQEYSSENLIKYCYINEDSKDCEIAPCHREDEIFLEKETIINHMNRKIESAELELKKLVQNKEIFLKMFGKYFNS